MTANSKTEAPLVGVIMGSRSDWDTMSHAVRTLEALGVPYEARVVSAHRTPDLLFDYAEAAVGRGLQVIIAGAGGAAHALVRSEHGYHEGVAPLGVGDLLHEDRGAVLAGTSAGASAVSGLQSWRTIAPTNQAVKAAASQRPNGACRATARHSARSTSGIVVRRRRS